MIQRDGVYNDKFVGANDPWRHSQWLEFLYQRLTLARELLTSDGVILVSINDENRDRLGLLMDEVFPGRRAGSLVWRTKDTGNDLSQRFSHIHEHVLFYANASFKFNGRVTGKSKFRNRDKDARGDRSPQPLTKTHTFTERENTYYPIQDPDTGYWYPRSIAVVVCLGIVLLSAVSCIAASRSVPQSPLVNSLAGILAPSLFASLSGRRRATYHKRKPRHSGTC